MAHDTGRILHNKRLEHERFTAEASGSADDTIKKMLAKEKDQRIVTTSLIELPSCSRHTLDGPYPNPREYKTESGTQLRWDQEDVDRLFSTKRDNRRVRLFKSLRLLPKTPKSVTVAEVGVQCPGGDEGTLYSAEEQAARLQQLIDSNTHGLYRIDDLQEQVRELKVRHETMQQNFRDKEAAEAQLQREVKEKKGLEEQVDELLSAYHQAQETAAEAEKANKAAEIDLQEMSSALEKKEIEVAFLQEEKEDAEKLAADRWTRLQQLNDKLMALEAHRDDFQALYTHAKAEYTHQLSRHLAKLQSALEDKRYLIKKGARQVARDTTSAEALHTAELFLEREEENCRLVEQIEYLSAQSVAQDLKIQQLYDELEEYKELAKLVFNVDGRIKGTKEAMLIKDRLIRRYSSETCRALGELINICGTMFGRQAQKQRAAAQQHATSPPSTSTCMTDSETDSRETDSSRHRQQQQGNRNNSKSSTMGSGDSPKHGPFRRLIGILKKPSRTPPPSQESSTNEVGDTSEPDSEHSSPRRLTWKDEIEQREEFSSTGNSSD